MALGVQADDLELESLALVDHVARMRHALVDSSLMWIKPSRPSRTRTKAPKFTSLVTVPSMTSPTLKSATVECHGSGCSLRMERLIRAALGG